MRHHDTIEQLLADEHVILRREHPELDDALTRACSGGRLARVLPGVYVDHGLREDPVVKMAAVTRRDRDAVIRGDGSARTGSGPGVRWG